MIKILSIGNSFSKDAHRYLHQIAKKDGFHLKCVNICIGGCSLATHYKNMNNDAKAYDFGFNGEDTGIQVTMREVLQSDEWDYVTFQQVSHQSPFYDTFYPYLKELSDYAKRHAPKTKQLIHQTWAYETGSEKLMSVGYNKQAEMFKDIKKSYEQAANDISAEGIIPSGQCMQNLSSNGIDKIHRDSFHADFGVARYAIALTWYGFLTKNPIDNIQLDTTDKPITKEEIDIACISAKEALGFVK